MTQGDKTRDPRAECQRAMNLAVEVLAEREIELERYRVVAAENLIKGPTYRGPQAWRITFKLRALLPDTTQAEVGAGGELLVEVDLSTGEAVLAGYGE